ncbi:MAG TPA: TonB family protein [Terriglobales bacterium]|jgi:TonB family protein|nr:TonB family protein [Terriglobales bacterium]
MNRPAKVLRALTLTSAITFSFLIFALQTEAQDTSKPEVPDGLVGPSKPSAGNSVEILTPTEGVDFNRYISELVSKVKMKWYASMPNSVFTGEKGVSSVMFQILKDGKIGEISLERSSGRDALDQAALSAIRDSGPLNPLPVAFKGPHIELRFTFYYNLGRGRPVDSSQTSCGVSADAKSSAPPLDRLEFLAFTSTNWDAPYEKQTVCQRGIDFDPDSKVILTFRINNVTPGLLETISTLKPQLATNPSPDRDRAFVTLQLALEDIRGGQPAAANVDYQRSLQLADDSASLHLTYAQYLTTIHKPLEAEAQARRSLELWPDNANAHVVLALALSLQGRDADAVSEAREALRIFPDHSGGLVELGFALARSGQYGEAIPILRVAGTRARNMVLIHKHLGVCLVHTREFAGAIEELNTFLKTTPNDAEAQYALGVALRETGKKDEAQAHFREASRLAPDNPIYSTVATPPTSTPAPAVGSTSSGPKPDEGFVSGDVYSNTFFGFSYQFPKGWTVLDARKSEFLLRMGGSVVANGDPILLDASEAAARNAYPLLLVAKETTKEIKPTVTLIQIQALDRKFTPEVKSGEEFARRGADLLRARSLALSINGAPEKFSIEGKQFWKLKMDFSMNNVVSHAVEVVTIEKGYVLLFVFTSPDASKLDNLVGTMQSLKFTEPRQ